MHYSQELEALVNERTTALLEEAKESTHFYWRCCRVRSFEASGAETRPCKFRSNLMFFNIGKSEVLMYEAQDIIQG